MSDPLEPILEAFSQLSQRADSLQGERTFSARPFPERPQHRIAIDAYGAPVILIHVVAKPSDLPPIQLAYLDVRHGVLCEIALPNGTQEKVVFTTIRFLGRKEDLHEYFLRVVGGAVLALPQQPTEKDVSRMVTRLAELLNALSQEPRQSAQGLWGEIFVIDRADNPVRAIQTWRESPEATFDFSAEHGFYEVKSTLSASRQHYFSIGQLRPEDSSEVIIISLLLRKSEKGTSLGDLIERVRVRLEKNQESRILFDQNIAATLGNSIQKALKVRFDVAFAEANLRLFRASDIPCIDPNLPTEISNVRFIVDLSQLPVTNAILFSPSIDQ